MSIRRDGAAGVTLRTGVTFTFVPTDVGVRLSVPRRPGDRLQFSAFFPRVRPRRRPHGLDGADAAVSWSGRARVRLLGGYASAVDPDLVRARIMLAPGRGPARLGVNFARPNPSTPTGHA